MTAANLEIERKFRLRAAPSAADLAAHGAVAKQIEQVYLLPAGVPSGASTAGGSASAGDAERVRRLIAADGTTTYRHTLKHRVGPFAFDERETAIDESVWAEALRRADPARQRVRKMRYVIPHGTQHLEIDVFDQPAGLVVLEVELATEAEAVELPAWLGEWREVTDDPAYLNVNLALRGAAVPPWG